MSLTKKDVNRIRKRIRALQGSFDPELQAKAEALNKYLQENGYAATQVSLAGGGSSVRGKKGRSF